MQSILRDKARLGIVVLVMLAIMLMQGGISYTMMIGELSSFVSEYRMLILNSMIALRLGVIALLVALWILNFKRTLFIAVIITNTLLTLGLMYQMNTLISVLLGSAVESANALIFDAGLMAMTNVLIFSIWYWIIDPPGVEDTTPTDKSWDFLFPQRGSSIPHYESWVPNYVDYLFVAFTNSIAFSPTDTLPLTKRSKILMMLQAAISVITLTGIASSAINLLAGR
jgi:hypothetical protein